MSSFDTIHIINDLAIEVRNFKRGRNGKTWNWSCEVCGDSTINKRKARFGVAIKDNVFVCHCFNCGYSNTLAGYLKDFHPLQYEKLTIDKFINNQPAMYDLNHLFDTLETKKLINIFYLNKFSNSKYWLDYLSKKKIILSENNIRKLYVMHKDYWNESRSVQQR